MKKIPSQGFTQVLSVCGLPVQGVLHLRSLPRGHLKFQHLRLKHSFRECVHEMPPDPAASTASWTQRAQAEIRVPRTVKQIPALSQKDIKAMMHTHTHTQVQLCKQLFPIICIYYGSSTLPCQGSSPPNTPDLLGLALSWV